MGLESDIELAAGILVVFNIVFYYVLKRLWKVFSKLNSRLERKAGDVAVYLSHVNEDRAHLEKSAANKIDKHWAETNFSAAFSEMKSQKAEKAKIKVTIGMK
ncbi:MAG TPA: hypothetical protein VJI13_00165 [Candidatus Norongarragalinales archaeon]|nr:hypothetical protein [Candidatus Norongarragalinales archaeon]